MKKLLIILIVFTWIPVVNLISADNPQVNIEGIENLGMGGPGTAIWTKYAVMYNPALIGLRTGFHINVFDFPVSISNDILKFYKFYKDNQEALEDFNDLSITRQTELLKEITEKITKLKVRIKLGVLNPNITAGSFPFPFLGQIDNLRWGIGLYNQLDAGVKMNPGILVPTIDFWTRTDTVIALPFSYHITHVPLKLPGEIYAGINFKYILRYKYEKRRMSILEFENFDIDKDDISPGGGFGWDWGMLYGFSEKLKFSLVLKDFLSTRIAYSDSSEVIKGQVSIGSSYKINRMITAAADLRDIKFSDIGKAAFFAKLYMGAELNLLRIVKLRGGFYQGYPSFGFGLAGIFNYAFYGRELSCYPGAMPEWNHVASLSLGF